MAKTPETLLLQTAIWKATNEKGTFACHEVGIEGHIVDFLTYNTKGEWRCFEIKVSKSDFYSKHDLTFVGHYNYFVMPPELYEQVKKDVPDHVGVYSYDLKRGLKITKNKPELYCFKRPKRVELAVSQDIMIYSLIKSFSREYDKSVKGTKPLCTWSIHQLTEELQGRGHK